MGVPQSRWGYSEVFDVHTYVPPKTQVAMMPEPAIFRFHPSEASQSQSRERDTGEGALSSNSGL